MRDRDTNWRISLEEGRGVGEHSWVKNGSFPARYAPVERLGKGGGGEVWAARDRFTARTVALKLLPKNSSEAEMMSLIREATMLRGLHGAGIPAVLHFGVLHEEGRRPYLVRELVAGQSLAHLIETSTDAVSCLAALGQAADCLTRLHSALILHGDIKPANIIVPPHGEATLVDLGLAAPWR
ncbi:MAG: protein kinase, partial [Myxococcota bacterium]